MGELRNESGLADTGLTMDQRNASTTRSGENPPVEVRETLLSLQQHGVVAETHFTGYFSQGLTEVKGPWNHAPPPGRLAYRVVQLHVRRLIRC